MVTQMNLLLDPIIVLNNQGCHLLGKGHSDQAMGKFKAALTLLRSTIHGHRETKNQTVTVDGSTSQSCLLPMYLKEFHRLLLLSDHDPNRNGSRDHSTTGSWMLPANNNNSPYVTFSLAIPILRGSNFSSEAADNEKVYTAVIVFNLGVTLHLKALESSSSGCIHHGLLKKAKSLYLHTHQLIVPILSAYLGQRQACCEKVAFDLLVMGLLNNVALIHLELFEYTECHCAFQQLIYYIKMVSSFRSSGRPGDCGREEDAHHDAQPSTNNQQHNHPDAVWLQPPPPQQHQSSGTPHRPDEEEAFRRIHRMMDQVLTDMIVNATHVKWHVMVAPAAAA